MTNTLPSQDEAACLARVDEELHEFAQVYPDLSAHYQRRHQNGEVFLTAEEPDHRTPGITSPAAIRKSKPAALATPWRPVAGCQS